MSVRWTLIPILGGLVIWPALYFPGHAADPSITISLSFFDHMATILEGLFSTLAVCGGFFGWLVKSRRDRELAVTAEISFAVKDEREERAHDVRGLKQIITFIQDDMKAIRESAAQRKDTDDLYRLIEKASDKAEAQHTALREQITTMVGGITARIDSIVERRLAPRAE